MPPARLTTVEFRSLLLPPIRIRLRALHTFARLPCIPATLQSARPAATCLNQRRSLHLYKTAKAKTGLGMQKILDFNLCAPEPPSESQHRINIVKNEDDHTPIATNVSLQEVYDKHIGPGKFLYMAHTISKTKSVDFKYLRDENIPAQLNNYAIVKAHTTAAVTLRAPQTNGEQLGSLKGVHLLLSNPIEYTKLALDRAYQFLEQGSPVEIRVRLLGHIPKKKRKSTPTTPDVWPWMHAHFPHLRPDFILRSMPEGTQYLIKPVSDGRCIQFVMSGTAEKMPTVDLTDRVFKVKQTIEQYGGQSALKMDGSAEEPLEKPNYRLNKHGAPGKPKTWVTNEKRKRVIWDDIKEAAAVEHAREYMDPEKDLDRRRQEQILGADAFAVEQRASGRTAVALDEDELSTTEAVKKLAVVNKAARSWRNNHDVRSGIDRLGVWSKVNPNKGTKTGKFIPKYRGPTD